MVLKLKLLLDMKLARVVVVVEDRTSSTKVVVQPVPSNADSTTGSSSTLEHPNTSTTVVNFHMKIHLGKEDDQPVKTSEGSPSAKSVCQATCARECHTQMNRRRYCVV